MAAVREYAVYAHQLERYYGSGDAKVQILKKMTCRVKSGSIYGLLGSSGCGKTTFLRTVIGRLRVHGGKLQVLGKTPGSPGHNVPGAGVGYMPQELALVPEFTSFELLIFFARLFHMNLAQARERADFLLSLLGIANQKHQIIQTMSGGQKRRLSLAAALLHNPKLCILDEPTVGVDPVLRARIWEHLVELVRSSNVTVIITTHYIEEARQAHCVGLMRDGHLLAEDTPDALLASHAKASLEDVFLSLCIASDQEHGEPNEEGTKGFSVQAAFTSLCASCFESPRRTSSPELQPLIGPPSPTRASSDGEKEKEKRHSGLSHDSTHSAFRPIHANASVNISSSEVEGGFPEEQRRGSNATLPPPPEGILKKPKPQRPPPSNGHGLLPKWSHVLSLTLKNMTRMRRNKAFMLFQLLLPAIQIILYCAAIGRPLTDIPVAVVNDDKGHAGYKLSTTYLDLLNHKTISQQTSPSLDAGRDRVRHGKCWGVLYFGTNYTQDLLARFSDPNAINGSEVELYLDNTDQQTSLTLQEATANAGLALMQEVLTNLSLPADIASLPVRIMPPIYGKANPDFMDFVAPGILATIIFAQSIGLTALGFVIDKKEGILDRQFVCGVRPFELILAHIISQLVIVFGQLISMLFFALYVFSVPLVGNLGLVVIVLVLLGLTGMTLGLLISTSVNEEYEAIQLAMACVFPTIILSGVIWPQTAIPNGLRQISMILPTTWGSAVLRSFLLRGWGLAQEDVWEGILIIIAWETVILLASVFRIRSVE